jgi:TPR repeat protein
MSYAPWRAPVRPLRAQAPSWRTQALAGLSDTELAAAFHGDAAAWLDAAACGTAAAQLRLGRLLLEGDGVARDPRAAFACFLCAAELGDAQAHDMLGRAYEHGWGTQADRSAARLCYRRSAEQGYFGGAYDYAALIAADGCIAGALHWFAQALGDAPATEARIMIAILSQHADSAIRALAFRHR